MAHAPLLLDTSCYSSQILLQRFQREGEHGNHLKLGRVRPEKVRREGFNPKVHAHADLFAVSFKLTFTSGFMRETCFEGSVIVFVRTAEQLLVEVWADVERSFELLNIIFLQIRFIHHLFHSFSCFQFIKYVQ